MAWETSTLWCVHSIYGVTATVAWIWCCPAGGTSWLCLTSLEASPLGMKTWYTPRKKHVWLGKSRKKWCLIWNMRFWINRFRGWDSHGFPWIPPRFTPLPREVLPERSRKYLDFARALRSLGSPNYCKCILSGWWFGTFFIFPYIGNNHPNWLIFFRGLQTTNQLLYVTLF